MTLALSWGEWGGFYWHSGFSKRICLGWLAVTFIPMDMDLIFDSLEVLKDGDRNDQ